MKILISDMGVAAKDLREKVLENNLPDNRECHPCLLHSAVIVQMTAVWQANSAMSGPRLIRSGPSANEEKISGNYYRLRLRLIKRGLAN